MNRPAYGIFGLTAFARLGQRGAGMAAHLGALVRGLALNARAGGARLALGRARGELDVFDHWQLVFAIDNGFLLWGLGLAIAWMAKHAFCIWPRIFRAIMTMRARMSGRFPTGSLTVPSALGVRVIMAMWWAWSRAGFGL